MFLFISLSQRHMERLIIVHNCSSFCCMTSSISWGAEWRRIVHLKSNLAASTSSSSSLYQFAALVRTNLTMAIKGGVRETPPNVSSCPWSKTDNRLLPLCLLRRFSCLFVSLWLLLCLLLRRRLRLRLSDWQRRTSRDLRKVGIGKSGSTERGTDWWEYCYVSTKKLSLVNSWIYDKRNYIYIPADEIHTVPNTHLEGGGKEAGNGKRRGRQRKIRRLTGVEEEWEDKRKTKEHDIELGNKRILLEPSIHMSIK